VLSRIERFNLVVFITNTTVWSINLWSRCQVHECCEVARAGNTPTRLFVV